MHELAGRGRGQRHHRRGGRRGDSSGASRECVSAANLSEFERPSLLWATAGQLWDSPCHGDGGYCTGNVRSGQWSKEENTSKPGIWSWSWRFNGRHWSVVLREAGRWAMEEMRICRVWPIEIHGVGKRRIRPSQIFFLQIRDRVKAHCKAFNGDLHTTSMLCSLNTKRSIELCRTYTKKWCFEIHHVLSRVPPTLLPFSERLHSSYPSYHHIHHSRGLTNVPGLGHSPI